jgi:LPS-assembly lipoprotein
LRINIHNNFATVKFAVLAVVLCVVAGCGYHLRGAVQWPPELDPVYIQGLGKQHPAVVELRQVLQAQDLAVNDVATDARAIVRILSEDINRRVASLNTAGVVSEYELVYRLKFAVDDMEGKALLPEQVIEVRRVHTVDTSQVVAKSAEEELLRQKMRAEAVRQLIRRLSAVGQGQ